MSNRDTNTSLPDRAERRLADLRREIPTAIVQIDSVRADDAAIAIKVTIGWPGGGRHTRIEAIDVDPNRSWASQLEHVQALAVLKALEGLGIAAAPPQADVSQPLQQPAPQPQPATPQTPEARAPQPPAASQPTPGASAVQRADGDHLAEYSWTSFWQAAHARNITKDQVEQALGRSIQQATPRDAVDALEAAGLWG